MNGCTVLQKRHLRNLSLSCSCAEMLKWASVLNIDLIRSLHNLRALPSSLAQSPSRFLGIHDLVTILLLRTLRHHREEKFQRHSQFPHHRSSQLPHPSIRNGDGDVGERARIRPLQSGLVDAGTMSRGLGLRPRLPVESARGGRVRKRAGGSRFGAAGGKRCGTSTEASAYVSAEPQQIADSEIERRQADAAKKSLWCMLPGEYDCRRDVPTRKEFKIGSISSQCLDIQQRSPVITCRRCDFWSPSNGCDDVYCEFTDLDRHFVLWISNLKASDI